MKKILRLIVFTKFIILDKQKYNLSYRNCWVLAGINTIMPKFSRYVR